jgi:hypothetical protein
VVAVAVVVVVVVVVAVVVVVVVVVVVGGMVGEPPLSACSKGARRRARTRFHASFLDHSHCRFGSHYCYYYFLARHPFVTVTAVVGDIAVVVVVDAVDDYDVVVVVGLSPMPLLPQIAPV